MSDPVLTEPVGPVLTLELQTGPRRGERFGLSGHTQFFVGRGPGVNLALEGDAQLSRVHFGIEANLPRARLLDMRSRNGTFLNGRRVDQADLRDGDRIRAGGTEVLIHMAGEPTAAPDDEGSFPVTVSTDPALNALPGVMVPGYDLGREIGQGGMGRVYLARRLSDGTTVAIKAVLPAVSPQPEVAGRFLREVSILRRLDHPHIVRHHEHGTVVGQLYFVMDYIDGPNAASLIRDQGPLLAERVVRLGGQLLDALAYAHKQGVVHRDVKPGNLLIVNPGAREHLMLADFGLARAYQASAMSGLTMSGQSGGTPSFMPPEQVMDFRSAKPAADQYAAAATLYNLLTGQTIYEPVASRVELLLNIVQTEPIPLRVPYTGPALPGRLGEVFRRALARRPCDRYPDIAAMRAELMAAL